MTSLEERIKQQEEKLRQLKELHQKQLAQKRAAQSKKERANDTRRKVLMGALLLRRMDADDDMKMEFLSELDRWLTKKEDRALFDFTFLTRKVDETTQSEHR